MRPHTGQADDIEAQRTDSVDPVSSTVNDASPSWLEKSEPADPAAPAANNGTRPPTAPEPALLFTLPFEIQAQIFRHCNYPTAIALRQTCTHFRKNFSPADTAGKAEAYREELFRNDDNSYPAPCYICLRSLPILKFDSLQPTHQPVARGFPLCFRKCIDCVLAANALSMGACFWKRDKQHVLCLRCRKIRPVQPRYGELTKGCCRYCSERITLRQWRRGLLKANTTHSILCAIVELALAIPLGYKVKGQWDQGLEQDRALFGWSLFICVFIVAVNFCFIPLVAYVNFLHAVEKGNLKRTPWRTKQTRYWKAHGAHRDGMEVLAFMMIVLAIIYMLISIGLTFTIKHTESLFIFGLLLFTNVASIITSIYRTILEPLPALR